MSLPVEDLIDRLATLIASINATGLTIGLSDGFTRAIDPEYPEDNPAATKHLAFGVVVNSSPIGDGNQQGWGGLASVRSAVSVYLCFQLRPASREADRRLAHKAAQLILKTICDRSLWNEGLARVVPEEAGRMTSLEDAVKVQIDAAVYHEITF